MMLEKARWHDPPASEEDLRRLLREVEAAKNRLFNRSNYSPSQRMLGHTPRTNGELMSDDAIDPVLLGHGQELEQLLATRRAAQKAFAEVNTSEAAQRALRGRNRAQRRFLPGEVIFVWRSWKEKGVLKPQWVGPGVVLMPEGANSFVNMNGRLWKVANEHLRAATGGEIQGIESVHQVFDDLRARHERAGSRLIEDHTQDPLPRGVDRSALEDENEVEREGRERGLPRPRHEEETPVPVVPIPVPVDPEPEVPEPPVPLP